MVTLDAAAIEALLAPARLELDVFDEIASTNTWLLEREFSATPAAPRLAVAARQTAGRGRRGRSWIAEPGRCACLSVAFESPTSPGSGLSLAVGCAVATVLAPLTDGLALKWPNDLLRGGRKCGGILIETRPGRVDSGSLHRVVIGIGLNLLAPSNTAAIGQPAGGLFDDDGNRPSAEVVIAAVAKACASAYTQHSTEGLAPFLAQWERLDAWRGREVELSEAGCVLARGVSLGLTASGALRLSTENGEQTIVSGDLSLRGTSQVGAKPGP